MQEFIFETAAKGAEDVDTLRLLEGEKKVGLFVDEAICRDVLFEKGEMQIACRVILNGYTFWLKPGYNEVPLSVADMIMTSPENSKHARYTFSSGAELTAPERDQLAMLGQSEITRHALEQQQSQLHANQHAALELRAMTEIL